MVRLPDSDKAVRLLRILLLLVFVFSFISPGGYVTADGEAGYALSFDGVDDFVLIGETNTVMGGDSWKDSMTVSLWVKPEEAGFCLVNDPAQCDSVIGDRPRWWGISHGVIDGEDRIWFWNMDQNGQDQIGIPYTAGEWMHISWVHSAGILSAYKNGILIASTPSGTTILPNTGAIPSIQIGAVIKNNISNWSFKGEIDEVSFFSLALTQNEIRDSIFSGFTGTETGLRAYYKMSDGIGTFLTDDSGNGFNGTLMDGTTVVIGNGTYPLWVISAAFDKPLVYDMTLSTNEDTPAIVTLSGLGAPAATLTYTYSDPINGSLSGIAPNLIYTPDSNYYGDDTFTYQVWDGSNGSTVATVSISISPINDTPLANSQIWSTDEDTAAGLVLTAYDVDGDTLTFSLVSSPTNGILSGTIPNFIYTPNENYFGEDSFTFRVNDTHVYSLNATVNITVNSVNDAPIAEDLIKNTLMSTPVDILLLASDIENNPLTFSIVDHPDNGVLSGVIPNLTYTPTGTYTGSDSFTYKVNDTFIDSNVATVNINISPGNLAPIADDQSVSTNEDIPKDITLTGSDPESAEITFEILDDPNHGILSGSAPDVVYTPNANYYGDDSFTFIVNDGSLDSSIATVSITVTPINDQPLANDQSVETNTDTPVSIILTGSDIDNNPLTFSIVTPPEHGSFTGTEPDLIYTPTSGYIGPDSFTFKVNDGLLDSAPATVSITILSANLPPIADAQDVETDEEVPIGITLTGSDPEGADLTYSFLTPPSHGSINSTNIPDLIYTPATNYYGTDFFVFRVYDGDVWSEPATVSILINPVNDLPRGLNQNLSTDQNVPLDILLTGSDPDGDFLTFEIYSDPLNGQLSGTLPNVVYTPPLNYTGNDFFRFLVFDGEAWSGPATIAIDVNSVNNPPNAVPDEYSVLFEQQLLITAPGVLDNDYDLNDDTITAVLVDDVAQGTLELAGDGSFTYHPDDGFVGEDQFTYRAFDGQDYSEVVTVTIHVLPDNKVFLPLVIK